MKVIGIAGKSGAGKNTVAESLSSKLSRIGFTVSIDSFGGPIKWICRARGWNGKQERRWRAEMQRLGVEARTTENWLARYSERLGDIVPLSVVDLAKLEKIANKWDVDKFVWWLAWRNGFTLDPVVKSWIPKAAGARLTQSDFLLIPDVRYPAEADFCKQLGILVYLDGSFRPLAPDLASHETESHLPVLRFMADYCFPHQESASVAAALMEIGFVDGSPNEGISVH